jgi:hypothetical protein
MALCVSRGRLALVSDNKTKVRLAKEAREAAVTALQMEPGNDLAHHLMGRWCVGGPGGEAGGWGWGGLEPRLPSHPPACVERCCIALQPWPGCEP